MSDCRIVRGMESGRIMLQHEDGHTFTVLRKGHHGYGIVGEETYLSDPQVEPWDGELVGEECAMLAKHVLEGL